jgi:hypothetical protein
LKNRFTVSRTGETGVLWFRFRRQKGNSGLNDVTAVTESKDLLFLYACGSVISTVYKDDLPQPAFFTSAKFISRTCAAPQARRAARRPGRHVCCRCRKTAYIEVTFHPRRTIIFFSGGLAVVSGR